MGVDDDIMNNKSPNPIDIHVGARVRMRRMLMSLSQEKLGERISLTFQQVQKYEKGVNRISASKLYEIASFLEVPVSYFFEGLADTAGPRAAGFAEGADPVPVVKFLSTAEGLQLNKAFIEIEDSSVRRKIVELVRALSRQAGHYEEN